MAPAGAVEPAQVREAAPGVFVRHGVHALMSAENEGGIANIGFIVGEEAVAVIDSGGSALDGLRLKAAIRARTDLPIRYVINSHVHPDHIFGNAAFLDEGAEFVGHHRLPRALAMRGAYYLKANRREMGEKALEGTEIVAPTRLVENQLVLNLGGRRLELTAHETAHTDNDLSVLDVKTGTLWTGDLLFMTHIPVIDGSLKGWLRVTEDLRATRARRAVPGHGPVAPSWPQALDPQVRYLTTLAGDLRALIADGKTISAAAEIAAASEKGSWQLFDEFNPRNATAGFAELEWE